MDKGIEMKAKLLKTAVLLFEEYGYNNTTIRMIAKKAGIGRGNLTYHFPKKVDLSRVLMKVFFRKIGKFTYDKLKDGSKDAYVYFALLLKSFEYFIDNSDYFKMMVQDGEESQIVYKQSCELYYELIQKKLILNNQNYDSHKLKRSINFAVLIFDNIVLKKSKHENEYNIQATSTAIRHFILELDESKERMTHLIRLANLSFEKIDLNKFYTYIMGYDYEDLLKELQMIDQQNRI